MKVKPILFAFVLAILLSIQNQIVGGEGSSNLDSSQYNDLVAIQVAGGKYGSREGQFRSIPQPATRNPHPAPCGMRDAGCGAPHPASRIPQS